MREEGAFDGQAAGCSPVARASGAPASGDASRPLTWKTKGPRLRAFLVAGQDLNLRPPGYEPPRSGTRVPPSFRRKTDPEPVFGLGRALRRNTVTSLRKLDACKTLAAWNRLEDVAGARVRENRGNESTAEIRPRRPESVVALRNQSERRA
jgi:hypothetical protein